MCVFGGGGVEGWKSTSSHTETINKLSSQSISYGLAWIIALCQSCLCAAWEQAQGDVIVKYEANTAVGLALIVTFVIKRAEESVGVLRRYRFSVRGVSVQAGEQGSVITVSSSVV